MLDHLLALEVDDEDGVLLTPAPQSIDAFKLTKQEDASATDVLNGKLGTHRWMERHNLAESPTKLDANLAATLAREAFVANFDNALEPDAAKGRMLRLTDPAPVAHLTGMLTAYDWNFVEQAKYLRSYVVAKLLALAEDASDANKLKALKMLGEVTEIGLFTTRVEINSRTLSDEDIQKEIDQRLLALSVDMPMVDEVPPAGEGG